MTDRETLAARIEAAVLAERERCAMIADENAAMWRDRARKEREKGRDDALAAMAAAEVKRTAAAIRSQP